LAGDFAEFRSAGARRDWIPTLAGVVLLMMVLSCKLCALEEPDSAAFSVTLAPGLSVGGTPDALHYSSYSVGVGLEYGPVFNLDGAVFKVSLESGYSQQMGMYDMYLDASDFVLRPYSAIIRRVPVMIWWTVESRANISPFIRFGAGVSWTQFSEKYSDTTANSLEASDWGFSWGIGGGIRLKLDQTWTLAVFLDDWVSTDDISGQVNSDRGSYSRGISGPIKMTMVGIRGLIIF
jgi:hypothetical protein